MNKLTKLFTVPITYVFHQPSKQASNTSLPVISSNRKVHILIHASTACQKRNSTFLYIPPITFHSISTTLNLPNSLRGKESRYRRWDFPLGKDFVQHDIVMGRTGDTLERSLRLQGEVPVAGLRDAAVNYSAIFRI